MTWDQIITKKLNELEKKMNNCEQIIKVHTDMHAMHLFNLDEIKKRTEEYLNLLKKELEKDGES